MARYIMVTLLKLLVVLSSALANTNYLLCHGQGKFLCYIPPPVDQLLSMGLQSSPYNVEVLTGDNGLYIQENNGPKTLSILDGDNDTYELGMTLDPPLLFTREPPLEQTFIRLKTIIDDEVYYLYSDDDGILLVDEETKNEAYDNRVYDPQEWMKYIFDIYGPY